MDLISKYALGDDIAVILLVLIALSLLVIAAGAILPRKLAPTGAAAEESALDPALGARLGSLLGTAGSLMLWLGIPALALMYLVPGSTDDRILRSAMMLVGLLLGPLAAWRGMMQLVSGLAVPVEDRARAMPRLAALAVGGALAVAIIPVCVTLWLLDGASGIALLSLAAGAAISAFVLRAVAAPVDAMGAGAVLLVGADENDVEPDDETALGAPIALAASILRRGGALSAEIVALATLLAAAGVLVGLPVLAAEAVLVVLLGLGIALLAALAVALIPHRGREGREAAALGLGGMLTSFLGGAGLVAAAVLWLPSKYKDLRFAQAGQANFTDPAIAGEKPVPRAELVPQIEQAVKDMGQWISATDDSRDAGAFLDVLTLYKVSPAGAVGTALGLGALAALGAILLSRTVAQRQGGTVRRAARTSRTGGAFGTASALSSGALIAAGAIALIGLVLGVISVLSAGVPELAMTLVVHAGLGALVVASGHAAVLLGSAFADRAGTQREVREAVTAGAPGPRAALLMSGALGALAVLAPIVTTIQLSPRGGSVWEERALHALTPMSLPVLGGALLGVVTVLLIAASLLDAARRAGGFAVVDARAARLEGDAELRIPDAFALVRRSAMTPVVVALLMPVAAGFGLGPTALPGLILGVVVCAAGLGLWALLSSATMTAAVATIGAGRYGGAGSWGHSGALTGAVLTGVLRSALGATALPLLLSTATIGALITPSATQTVWGGDVDPFLRWGIAVVAVLIAGTFWVITATAPEVDLEDGQEDLEQPLFANEADEQADSADIDAMSWDAEEESSETVVVPARTRKKRERKRGKNGSARADDVDED